MDLEGDGASTPILVLGDHRHPLGSKHVEGVGYRAIDIKPCGRCAVLKLELNPDRGHAILIGGNIRGHIVEDKGLAHLNGVIRGQGGGCRLAGRNRVYPRSDVLDKEQTWIGKWILGLSCGIGNAWNNLDATGGLEGAVLEDHLVGHGTG